MAPTTRSIRKKFQSRREEGHGEQESPTAAVIDPKGDPVVVIGTGLDQKFAKINT